MKKDMAGNKIYYELAVKKSDDNTCDKFKYTANELGAPDAEHKTNLFDWQMENAGFKTIEKFGGLNHIAETLGTDLLKGLSNYQVLDPKREEIYGNNHHPKHKPVTYCEIVCEGLHEVLIQVFIVAAVVAIIAGMATEGPETGWIDGFAILIAVVVIINVEAITDMGKDKQFADLTEINANKEIKVLREGIEQTISTDNLVVGDIMILTGGDSVPADGILISGVNGKVDESKITGEYRQVIKDKENPFLVSSSDVHDGYMTCLVVAVGRNSVFGKLESLVESSEDTTPLQEKLEGLTEQISIVSVILAVLVTVILLLIHFIQFGTGKGTVNENGDPYWDKSNWNSLLSYILTGISYLIVMVPEGLPFAVAIALAYSVKRMMKDNNLVRHINACETMGGANTICSDKTGTLTKGQMSVVQAWILDGKGRYLVDRKGDMNEEKVFIEESKKISSEIKELICENCCLNNDGFMTDDKNERAIGSSVDAALLYWMKKIGIDYKSIRNHFPKTTEEIKDKASVIATIPFHSDRKRSSCVVKYSENKYRVYVKGAPEMLVRLSENMQSTDGELKVLDGILSEDEDGHIVGEGSRQRLVETVVNKMAKKGLRIIGLAYRDFDHPIDWSELVEYSSVDQKGVGLCPAIEDKLTLVGFLGLEDPIRPEVPACVLRCQDAGIFVRMVTGDAMDTAKSIAKQCHIYHPQCHRDKHNIHYPPGVCMSGSQFRELVGGLVLPPHFNHECHCHDYSMDKHFKADYVSPQGFPSIVGHRTSLCNMWKREAIEKRKDACTDECKKYGCVRQLGKDPKQHDQESQKYKVIRNQAEFDPLVNTLQVLARSAPTDKHLLVTGLMERGQIVAVTGDGTNDAPALAKSNVGFAMGIGGTSVAQEASDIILMDDSFLSIVAAVKWGRSVYDNCRKFIQFTLAIGAVATVIGFVTAITIHETPITPVQMQWIHLIMDTFASLALATEYPTDELLERTPYNKDEFIISPTMFRNIASYLCFQVMIVLFITFGGHNIFGEPIGIGLGYGSKPTTHVTMIFHTFALLQIFNQIDARKIYNECNFFSNMFSTPAFSCIWLFEIIIQILIVTFGSTVFHCKRLTVVQHLLCILIACFAVINGVVCRFVPPRLYNGLKYIGSENKYRKEELAGLLYPVYRKRTASVYACCNEPRQSKLGKSTLTKISGYVKDRRSIF